MADTNINDNRTPDSGGSATTVLVTIIIVVIIGLAFWFGYGRAHWGGAAAPASNGTSIDINATLPAGSGQTPAPNQ